MLIMKTRLFIVTAGVMLTITALAKLVSTYQTVAYLNLRDPLFDFLTNRQLLSGAAAVELLVVLLLVWGKNEQKCLALIAWISSMFLLYRVSVHLVKASGSIPCPCLGNAAAWLHLDWTIKAMLAYLLVGSFGLLISLHLFKKKETTSLVSSSCGVGV